MTDHSLVSALRNTLPDKILLGDVESQKTYDVVIRFHFAENLPKTDIIGRGDPYFVAKIDHQITFISTIEPDTSNPLWKDEEWIVRNIPHNAKLTVKLYDKDDDKLLDDYIGFFDIQDLVNYRPPSKGHKITGPVGQCNGHFHLSIESTPSNDESRRLPPYTYDGHCRYSRHDSLAMGRLTMINTNCVYSTWKIELRRISCFFPLYKRQHWNRDYHAARNIFGNCPLSLASLTAIKIAHKALYGRTLKHNQNGCLYSADDLWKIAFTDPTTQRIKPCLYTYVIDDYTWRFSETGHQFFTDCASKHALLANGSKYVRYAGEFHLRPKNGWDRCAEEWEIVLDNGSGTYAPSADLLIHLKELLEFNFPGLNIAVYDYKDPELKESIEQLKLAKKSFAQMTPTIEHLVYPYKKISLPEIEQTKL